MNIVLYSRISVQDAQGRIVRSGRWRKSHSFVRQFIHIVCALTRNANVSTKDTGNVARLINFLTSAGYSGWEAAAAISTHGPVIGTGSTAVAIGDYKLDTQIAHGVAATQMEYAATVISEVSVVGSTASYTVSRIFTNSSGATITVNEFGIYQTHRDNSGVQRFFCVARDLIAGGQAVAHGQTITVEYKISVTAG